MEHVASLKRNLVVTRPPRVPYTLKAICEETGRPPAQIIAEAVARYPTFAGAAAALGVSERTLLKWRWQFGIEVAP
jgi:hypothetical protein